MLCALALACGGASSNQPPASLPAGGTWRSLSAMPAPRQELATAVLNGKIFVIAGFDGAGQPTDSVFIYDPSTDRWSSGAPLPIENHHPGAAVARGTLFAFGGLSNRTFAYDPAPDAWKDVAPARFRHGDTPAVAVLDDRIYVAGGTGAGMIGNEVESYDPATDSWTTLAPMRVPRNHCAGGFIGGRFYVAGGRPGVGAESALEAYDPRADVWTTLPSMPTGRSGVAAAAVNGRLYVFGGEGARIFGEVEVFDPVTNAWSRLSAMPTPRHGIFASAIGSSVYLPGGATSPGFAATRINEVFEVQ
jgi:N-acetylneuraminic acid mutarotase